MAKRERVSSDGQNKVGDGVHLVRRNQSRCMAHACKLHQLSLGAALCHLLRGSHRQQVGLRAAQQQGGPRKGFRDVKGGGPRASAKNKKGAKKVEVEDVD